MKILIATDGSSFSEAAIKECCQIVKNAERLEFKIVSAIESPAFDYSAPYAPSNEYCQTLVTINRKIAECSIEAAEKILRGAFANAELNVAQTARVGLAAQIIVEEAEDWNADLIVLGSHGRGFWGRMFLGSISQSVAQSSSCSVLIVRNRQHES